MRYTITTRVNIENAPYDPDDTAAELTDSIRHWIADGYRQTDPIFDHNAVTVDAVVHSETLPFEEAMRSLRELHESISAKDEEWDNLLAVEAAEAEERADWYGHDEKLADINEEKAGELGNLLDAVWAVLKVVR